MTGVKKILRTVSILRVWFMNHGICCHCHVRKVKPERDSKGGKRWKIFLTLGVNIEERLLFANFVTYLSL